MQRTDIVAESPVRFDLLDIVQVIVRRRKFIFLVTGLAFLVGLASYFLSKPKYEARAELLVSNPLYADRTRIFSREVYVDYFANEQVNDRALAIVGSDQVAREIVRRNGLLDIYNLKADKPADFEKAIKWMRGSLNVRRTEFGSIQVSYTDVNPERAAQIANSAVAILEESFYRYVSGLRTNTVAALQQRVAASDSAIRVLTDSLVALRERTGFYELIAPNRYGMILPSGMRSTDARAIEEIQNLESVKDQYVIDRARYITMTAESSAGIDEKESPIVRIISNAETPGKRSGMSMLFTLLTFTLAGLFFSSLWVVFSGWFRRVALALKDREEI